MRRKEMILFSSPTYTLSWRNKRRNYHVYYLLENIAIVLLRYSDNILTFVNHSTSIFTANLHLNQTKLIVIN